MKQIYLTHAEVQEGFKGKPALMTFKGEKGTSLSWSVKVKINDRTEKSPVSFERCSFFAKTDEEAKFIQDRVKAGAILTIKGIANRRKNPKDEKWYEQIDVKELTAISGEPKSDTAPPEQNPDDFLPF